MNGPFHTDQNIPPIRAELQPMITAEHPRDSTASVFLGMVVLCFIFHLVTLIVALYGVLPHYPGAPSVEPARVIGAAVGGSGAGFSAAIFMCARRHAPHSQSMLVRLFLSLNVAATTYAWTIYVGSYDFVLVMFALGVLQVVWFSCLGLQGRDKERRVVA